MRLQAGRGGRECVTADLGCRRDGIREQRRCERGPGLLGERGAFEEGVDGALLVAGVKRDAGGGAEKFRACSGIETRLRDAFVDEGARRRRPSGEEGGVRGGREEAGAIGSRPGQPRGTSNPAAAAW